MFADQGFDKKKFKVVQKGCRVTATATGLNSDMRWTVLDSSRSKYAIYAFGTDTTTLGATVECYQSNGKNVCKIEDVTNWAADDKLEMQCTYNSERFLSPEVDLSFEISTSSKAELTMRALLDAQVSSSQTCAQRFDLNFADEDDEKDYVMEDPVSTVCGATTIVA